MSQSSENSVAEEMHPQSSPPATHNNKKQATAGNPATGSDAMDSGASPEGSGEEESGVMSMDDVLSDDGSAKSYDGDSPVKAETDASNATGEGGTPSMPVQKRRRVTRACDECRRKKIKCDGKQPCTHCSVYSYECTYDKPSNRRRNPAPQYIEALESRLQRAEVLLRKFMPDVDLNDPGLDPAVQQEFQSRERARAQAAKLKKEEQQQGDNQGAHIMSMIETIGQLDLTEGGEWDFHGTSSGAVFLKRMKEHFRDLLGQDYRQPYLSRIPRPPGMFNLDSPRSSASSPWDSTLPNISDLPPKEHARKLCYFSLNCATCLLRFVHIPSFYEMFDRIYDNPPETFSVEDNRSLSLVYSVLALGCMYNVSSDSGGSPAHYKTAMEEGTKYYAAARLLLQDITECRDLTSLQALLFMILFLQATSNLSGCYAFVGIALRAALRMGLHRHLPHAKLNLIEIESRRRVFYVTRIMDTYVSALLGFPLLLRDEDIDQPLPTEVDDEYITKEAIITPPAGTPSFFEAFNAHSKLMDILAKVIKHIYPLKGIEACGSGGERPNSTYMISYAKIKEMEGELQEWYEHLPIRWRPSPDGPIEVVRVRTLLRFAYAHVQMMLYRPFLHYISHRSSTGKSIDDRYYACAAAGISVSRNIVHIGMEIRKQAAMIGPYWFILYTEFFAILSLVFYALENPDKPGSTEILADASAGRDVIASFSQRSLAADRVSRALDILFEQLPDRTKKGKARPVPTKKRSAPGSKSSAMPIPTPSVPQARRSEDVGRSSAAHEQLRQVSHRISFDTGQRPNGRPQQFMASYSDLLPLDMSPVTGSPDSSETPTSSHRSVAGFPGPRPGGSANPLYKLDAIMFPSGDPFAYPNQPAAEFGMHHHGGGGAQSGHPGSAGPHQDSMQFYMPNVYDDIEGQLLGPIPSYLMQSPSHGSGGQMYNASNMLGMQQHSQAQQVQQAQEAARQRQQREIEELLLADPAFDVFPPGYRPL